MHPLYKVGMMMSGCGGMCQKLTSVSRSLSDMGYTFINMLGIFRLNHPRRGGHPHGERPKIRKPTGWGVRARWAASVIAQRPVSG